MVKLLDPFSGYLLAYGNNLLHIGYFVAILILPEEAMCSAADYRLSKILLSVSHIIVFILQLISWIVSVTDHAVVGHVLDWMSLFFYQGSIFYV